MAQSYQKGIDTGAEANHPAQKPNVTADQGIAEQANQRPDVASNKDTSQHTDTGGNANVPPNPEEVKAETGKENKDDDTKAEGEGEDKPKPPGGGEYPEQKHAGKVGYGPAYAETHGVVGLSERFDGLKTEIKGKILRKPEIAQQGHDKLTGEAKRRELQEEQKPIAGPDPNADPTAGDKPEEEDKKDSSDNKGQVAKGAEGDKSVAQAANENAGDEDKDNSSVAKEAEAKDKSATSQQSQTPSSRQGQPEDIGEKQNATSDEKTSQPNPPAPNKDQQQSQAPNPPAPHSDQQPDDKAISSGGDNQQHKSYNPDSTPAPNPPMPFKSQSGSQDQSQSQSAGSDNQTQVETGSRAVKTSPPETHQGNAE